MLKVLITHSLPEEGLKELREKFNIIMPKSGHINQEMLDTHIKDCDAILCTYAFKVRKGIIEKAKKLKIIANFGVGIDNIDIEYAKSKNICVTNSPGNSDIPVAELTIALMLDLIRKVTFNDRKMRESAPDNIIDVTSNLGNTVSGKKLGLVGIGKIAKSVAKIASVLGMKIIYHNRRRLPSDEEHSLNIEWKDSLKDLLHEADIVSLHIPSTDENTHIIGFKEFSIMKNSAYIVNTARGSLIDEEALINSLNNGEIAGAALDVFENEKNINPKLFECKNLILSPHNGTGSIEARIRNTLTASSNIMNFFYGKKEKINLC